MSVTLDLFEDSSIDVTAGGTVVRRSGILKGLTSPKDRWLWDAVNAPGVPRWFDFHPVVPFVRAMNIQVVPTGADKAKLTVIYEVPQGGVDAEADDTVRPQISVGSTLVSEITQVNKDGNVLNISIDVTETDADGVETVTTETQIAQTEIDRPQLLLRLQRKETSHPAQKALAYVGRVNRLRFFIGEPRTWLCTAIEGDSQDGGVSYLVTYEFQHNPATWDKRLVYIDLDTGSVHEQVNFQTGNGTKTYRVLEEMDFGGLQLQL